MRLSNSLISLLRKSLYIMTVCLLVITYCQLAFIGKNLTYSTRFTPFESEQNTLRNQTYITEGQALILFVSILYQFLLPTATYSCIKHQRKAFYPILLATLGVDAFLLFLNFYFLVGASTYRNYMNSKYEEITASGVCENNKTSLCVIGTCNRMRVFEEARSMAIAFVVINIVFSILYGLAAVIVNKKRKDSAKMELIV